ncbi:MAG: ABC transporter permease [Myxococcota bacterium]|nr:ABC transporter permease [Myxococcota bacterium]
MDFFWILASLRRQRAIALLIVLEVAFTCAIVCNIMFLISDRLTRMDHSSGVAEAELIRVRVAAIGKKPDAKSLTALDLGALRALPGVTSAAVTNMVPFGGSAWNTSASTIRDDPSPPINVAMYMGGPTLLETFGVRVTAGRAFTPDDFVDYDQANPPAVPSIIITRRVAERLFPGKDPIGQELYVTGPSPQRVVGVIDQLARPNDFDGPENAGYAVVVSQALTYPVARNYVLRVDAGRRDEVLSGIDAALAQVDPNRIVVARQTFAEVRAGFFKQDRAMIYLLLTVSLALLVVTALGIVGLASFWVQKRTRQIGIRRALGATRRDIVRYFQLENFVLATIGIVGGMVLAFAINAWLIRAYHVPRLPGSVLPFGAVTLWILGQIAVLGPGLRASRIPPAIATRMV